VKGAEIAAVLVLLAGCDESALERRAPAPSAEPPPTGSGSLAASGSTPGASAPPPLLLGPSTSPAVPREEREREVEALLAGRSRAPALEVEATDRDKEWSPGLRGMLGRPKASKLKLGAVQGEGLPAEAVTRVVHHHLGALRLCYETGLLYNPSLQGRVGVRFAVDGNGNVTSAENGGSDLPDGDVVTCVLKTFRKLSFPRPERGPVEVSVPILFDPPE
jgi:hypothetical protein